MAKKYQHLLSPLKIGNVVIKNRTLFPNASPHFLQGPETFPAESLRAFYANIAKNGCAIITLAEWSNPNQRKGPYYSDGTHMQNFDYTDPSVGNYFSQLADEIHFYGSKILVGINFPDFPEGYSLNGSKAMNMGPMGPRPATEPATKEMIQQNIQDFVEKCRRFRAYGYDGYSMRVEGNLAASGGMMGPSMRTDEYDGSTLENRTRYILECADAVKKAFPEWIIEFGIAGEQPKGYNGGSVGYELDTAIEFAKLCEGRIDILQLREKDMCKSHPTGFTFQKGEHEVIRYAEAIKAAGVKKLLLQPVGGFQDPEELDRYIAEGKCDIIGMARAFFADPEYGIKLQEGRGQDITPCLWCNKCHGTILDDPDPWISVCSVNPKMGIESKVDRMVDAPGKAKKVAIIGGGPAGMRTAIYAAQRGHAVTVYEKTNQLGGQIIHGDYASFKWPIGEYKAWLIRQLEENGVKVVLNCAATPELIAAEGYDAVVACTGAAPKIPGSMEGFADENGALKPAYKFCTDVFGHEAELGKDVVIVGASETGVETAMYLCENGHNVTLLTRQKTIGHDCSKLHYITMAFVGVDPVTGREGMRPAWEQYENLKGITNVTTKKVEGNTVYYVDAAGKEASITADSVVLCGGMKPLTDEALSFADAADQFLLVGDCNGCGNLQKVNRQAFSRAMQL
jgi:2,4-dienoyl-CoA reductase-like NADH-dependent reductase (Old Yellow Enzyme family)/NADPH-dependent 2,4-dienoyl-CoA reductase/sulfur reductase-like enzyme